jgi:hypothetical protein
MATKIKNALKRFGDKFLEAMIASGERRAAQVLKDRAMWYV